MVELDLRKLSAPIEALRPELADAVRGVGFVGDRPRVRCARGGGAGDFDADPHRLAGCGAAHLAMPHDEGFAGCVDRDGG